MISVFFKKGSVSRLLMGGVFLFLLTLTSSVMAEERTGNVYGLPPCVTTSGEQIDFIIKIIFWLTGVVFVATQGTYIYYLIRYRRRPGVPAHYSHGNNTLEIIWTTLPTIIFLALAIYSNRVWEEIHRPAPENALTIDVSSYQFGWEMRYPGVAGKLAPMDVRKISPTNRWGTDAEDPRTVQDVISTELVIPVGRPVHLLLHARDVIHAFYVPEFRLYQDCVPGRTIGWVWFQATRTGNFQIACNQLCGTGHYNMKAPIKVVSEEEYQKWITPRQQKNAGLPAPSAAANPAKAAHLTEKSAENTL
ncbi:MAG: cytochrome c oxidase subunit II [bacterium]